MSVQAAAPGSVSDYQLPPGPTAAPPPVQGPVDSDVPSVRPTRPASQPSPSPAPAQQPRVVVPTYAPARAPRPSPPTRDQQPLAESTMEPPASASEAPFAPASQAALPGPTPETAPLSQPTPTPLPWSWIALAGGVAAAITALLLMRRRRKRGERDVPDEEPATPAQPDVSAPAALPPRQAPAAEPPSPVSAPLTDGIEFQFEPVQLTRTLVYATLSYRLTLINRGAAAIGPAHVLADLISAHASLAVQDQLSLDPAGLHLRHEVPALAPGATLALTGDLRIPVAAIRPLRQGAAALFVPLARFRIARADGSGADHVFVVGQLSDQPGGPLRPLRIDGMPGVIKLLDQRRVVAAPA